MGGTVPARVGGNIGTLTPNQLMSLTSLPTGFSWLHPAYRPSDQEVDEYAHIIANAEGYPAESNALSLYREAELQLWIWRTENRRRGPRKRALRQGEQSATR
jgi:hypothetical protein